MIIFICIFIIIIICVISISKYAGADDDNIYLTEKTLDIQELKYSEKLSITDNNLRKYFRNIYFLNNYAKAGDTVVYNNCAPGKYLPELISKFSNLKFIFYDSAEFIHSIDRQNYKLTPEIAAQYNGILFINDVDIRIGREEFIVQQDMLCKKFGSIKRAMIQITEGMNYAGKIIMEPYQNYSSQILTLITKCKKYTEYTDLYDRTQYHNQILRNNKYKGYDCYDCWAENFILNDNNFIPRHEPEFRHIKYIPHYDRLLNRDKLPFEPMNTCEQICFKAGQRKLLMTEIEFYTKYLEPGETVVYAGAAPGHHNMLIFKLFPDNYWEFYDSNKFHDFKYDKCHTFCRYFTLDDAAHYGSSNARNEWGKSLNKFLFLTDIRTGSSENDVDIDMELQKQWLELMKPNLKMSMIKFRLPWIYGKTEYYSGDIYLQPRIGATSTETRLYTDCTGYKVYDNDEYNDQLYYFNRFMRNAWHDYELTPGVPGLCHCYDCWAETKIINEYIKKYGGYTTAEMFNIIDKYTHQPLNTPPHGMLIGECDIEKKIDSLCEITEKYLGVLEKKRKSYTKK